LHFCSGWLQSKLTGFKVSKHVEKQSTTNKQHFNVNLHLHTSGSGDTDLPNQYTERRLLKMSSEGMLTPTTTATITTTTTTTTTTNDANDALADDWISEGFVFTKKRGSNGDNLKDDWVEL
jgi:hypothetical protein